MDARRSVAVRADDGILGGCSPGLEPAGQRGAAVQLQTLAVGGPAGEEEARGLAFAAEALGDLFGPLQQADGRAVHRAHPHDRDQLRECRELQLQQ